VSVDMMQRECCELQVSSLQEEDRVGMFITVVMERTDRHTAS
jgi:hypothetical protein